MRARGFVCSLVVVIAVAAGLPAPALAAFHWMEIEQVIGGVDGDTAAQAVQLRMRFGGQNLLAGAVRMRAWDAAGANPVVLTTFPAPNPTGAAACARVLIATPGFEAVTTPPVTAAAADYTMAAIPASYLAGGSLTFENISGSLVYWRLSWGAWTALGPVAAGTNDDNTTMNPPFPGPLPSTGLDALRFTPACSTLGTTNLAQYALSAGAATFTNNDATAFVVTGLPPEPPDVPVLPGFGGLALVVGLGALALGAAVVRRRLT